MKRTRRKLLLLGLALSGAAGWSGHAFAQAKVPRIGILAFSLTMMKSTTYDAFYRTLRQPGGLVEGESVVLEYASAESDPSRYAQAAAELVRRKVDVIFADSASALRAAHAATRTIPIVGIDFTTDPVAAGYAQSYGRPGGNVTGIFLDAPEFSAKWVEVLRGLLPGLSRIVALWDPTPGAVHRDALEGVARAFNLQLQVIEVRKPADIDAAGAAFRGRPQALIVLPSPMLYLESERLSKLALAQRLPATSFSPFFAQAGGLISYGPDLASTYERIALLIGRILKGAKPGDLPIERPTQIKLIINVKTAKALGIAIPDSVLARADEIIR